MLADEMGKKTAILLGKFGSSLHSFFSRRIKSEDAEDLVQEVFLKLQTSKSSAPIENIEGYLFSTARSVLVDYYRQNSRPGIVSSEFKVERHGGVDRLSPERIAIGQEEYLCVMKTIRDLPPRTRQAFELHRFENLTYHAIAEKMGISRESVKDLMHRALLRIAEELREVQ